MDASSRYSAMRSVCASALGAPNVKAFLAVIRRGEGTADDAGYRRMVGGEMLASLADHPRRKVRVRIGRRILVSSAAGAYQFLEVTWHECARMLHLDTFEPHNQDLAAVYLIQRRGALGEVLNGRFESALAKCAKEWASLPGSPYGQPTISMTVAVKTYLAAGGQVEDVPMRASARSAVAGVDDDNVDSFVAAALPAMTTAVPELATLFGGGEGPLPARGREAAAKVVAIAQDVLGVPDAETAACKLAEDPQAAAALREAVMSQWYDITEIDRRAPDPRAFALAYAGAPQLRTVLGTGLTFLETLTLLLVPAAFVVGMAAVFATEVSNEFKAAIVTALSISTVTGIVGFWFGSSMSNRAKDDTIRDLARK